MHSPIKRPYFVCRRKYSETDWQYIGSTPKRSYMWTVLGKRIRIVMPRMPRSRKEARKRLAALKKAIRRNPLGRCLIAIYANLA
ncbi:unnamed protein product [Gongylonema pulchrum]|uniref:Integrase n=1 Tax=Gongylonema pulchrum TaxID=637853 RepID=A0A183D2V8_9BILA|nr:unnamed protein product [Gongylonema pulchrum]